MNEIQVGYKIDSGHFKLGSKIHIEHFYYAKRLFQNGYYATRFSYLLAKDIVERKMLDELEEITLVGYGLYSELMVNRVRSLISYQYPDKKVNYNLISDSENLQVLNTNPIYNNVIIIIPIATTFSTSIKIESFIKANHKHKQTLKIIQPYYNILVVGDGDFESEERIKQFNDSKKKSDHEDILSKFNWEKIDPEKKEIVISSLQGSKKILRTQRYFICLPSKWHSIDDCGLCFPTDIVNEKILIDTDPVSVTPNLIFELPALNDDDLPTNKAVPIFTEKTLLYGHRGKKPFCFLYKIRREIFLRDNEAGIRDWLGKLKGKISFKGKRVILISPGHYMDTSFLDYVNEIIFDNKAMVIHYKPDEDFINNFVTFYRGEITRAHGIIYVDDVMASGMVFRQLNNFVRQIRNNSITTVKKGIDSIISLIDRSDHYTKKQITWEIGRENLHVYFRLLVAPLNIPHIGCPLCLKYKQFDTLIESSMLDSLKYYLASKRDKIKLREDSSDSQKELDFDPFINDRITPSPNRNPTNLNNAISSFKLRNSKPIFDKNLLKLFVTHEMNIILCKEEWREKIYTNSIQGKQYKLFSEIITELKNSRSLKPYFIEELPDETEIKDQILRTVLIKVLTGSPFVYYKNIRELSFDWVKAELYRIINITNTIQDWQFNFNQIRHFKLLLRRSVVLKSNFVISYELLAYLKQFFDGDSVKLQDKLNHLGKLFGIYELLKKKGQVDPFFLKQVCFNLNYKLERIFEFNYFILALVKELIQDSEAKSIHLEINLNRIALECNFETPKAIDNVDKDDFFYLWRLLKLENTGTLNQFLAHHFSNSDKSDEYKQFYQHIPECDKISDWLNLTYFSDKVDYKVEPIRKFLATGIFKADLQPFIEVITLIDFLRLSQPIHQIDNPLEKKLEIIQSFIIRILGLDPNTTTATIAVEYRTSSKDDPTSSIYTQCGISPITKSLSKTGVLLEMLNGISNTNKGFPQTFIELIKQAPFGFKGIRKKYFRSLFSSLYKEEYPENALDLSEALYDDINNETLSATHSHFLFYRLASLSNKNDQMRDAGQAVITISSITKVLHSPERIRLLLLAKEHLIEFLETHFRNDSFIEMLENKAKLETLTTLQHGLNRYVDSLVKRIGRSNLSKQEKIEMDIITTFIDNQLSNYTLYHSPMPDQSKDTYAPIKLVQKIKFIEKVIFKDIFIGNRKFSDKQIEDSFESGTRSITIYNFILYQIIPELLVNVKKANQDLLSSEKLKIKWKITDSYIEVSNTMGQVTASESKIPRSTLKSHGGIEMCTKLLEKVGLPPLSTGIKGKYFVVRFSLKPSKNEKSKSTAN
jgi:hypothetical protein